MLQFRKSHFVFVLVTVFIFCANFVLGSFISFNPSHQICVEIDRHSKRNNNRVCLSFEKENESEFYEGYNIFSRRNFSLYSKGNFSLNSEIKNLTFFKTKRNQSNFLYCDMGVLSVNETFGWKNFNKNSIFISQRLGVEYFGQPYVTDFSDKFLYVNGIKMNVAGFYYTSEISGNKNPSLGDFYTKAFSETIFVSMDTILPFEFDSTCLTFLSNDKELFQDYKLATNYSQSINSISYDLKPIDNSENFNSFVSLLKSGKIRTTSIFVFAFLLLISICFLIFIYVFYFKKYISSLFICVVGLLFLLFALVFCLVFSPFSIPPFTLCFVNDGTLFFFAVSSLELLSFLLIQAKKREYSNLCSINVEKKDIFV